ncbi:hypothetical protein [Paenibacillus brasilensis]
MTTELKRVRRSIEDEKENGKWGGASHHGRDWIEALLFSVQENLAKRDAIEFGSPLDEWTRQAKQHGQHQVLPALDWGSYQVILLDLRIPDWDRQARQAAANSIWRRCTGSRAEVWYLRPESIRACCFPLRSKRRKTLFRCWHPGGKS